MRSLSEYGSQEVPEAQSRMHVDGLLSRPDATTMMPTACDGSGLCHAPSVPGTSVAR